MNVCFNCGAAHDSYCPNCDKDLILRYTQEHEQIKNSKFTGTVESEKVNYLS